MKYLKYFENITDPEIEVGQQWIKNDKSNIIIINKIDDPSNKIRIILKDGKKNNLIYVEKSYLDNYTLIKNESYNTYELDFYKTSYIPTEKSIVGAYFIKEQNDKSITILNIKEYRRGSTYVDGANQYTISIETIILPIKEIKIIKEDENRKGFFYLEIPYWLYKNNMNQLEIKRLKAPHKRIYLEKRDETNKNIIDAFKDESIFDYFRSSDYDGRTQELLKTFYARINTTSKANHLI